MGANDRNPLRASEWSVLVRTLMVVMLGAAVGCGVDPAEPIGTGGSTSSGGSESGGTIGSGGSAGSGGAAGSGGSEKTGGTQAMGGASSGGTTGSGGSEEAGGAQGTGGATRAGGRQGTGGGTASGGSMTGTGGYTQASTTEPRRTGGATRAGGVIGTGGARPDGGGTGGTSGTGGGTGDTFNPCPAGTACKIMPLGDSITEGFGYRGTSSEPDNQGGYRIELFRQAVTKNKNITFVGNLTNGPSTVDNKTFPKNHEGHGGWTISQIAGIADNRLSTYKPDIVLLKIGTNDVNGTGSSGAPNGLKNLIDQITKDVPSALLVVSSIIPITNDSTNQRVKTYNATIPTTVDAAAAAGKHVIFVDAYAAFVADASWKTKYMADSLHPNDPGYALLGQTWYAAISSVLPAP